jgi:hypothetical protein
MDTNGRGGQRCGSLKATMAAVLPLDFGYGGGALTTDKRQWGAVVVLVACSRRKNGEGGGKIRSSSDSTMALL